MTASFSVFEPVVAAVVAAVVTTVVVDAVRFSQFLIVKVKKLQPLFK